MLDFAGLESLIVNSVNDYVNLAVRIAREEDYGRSLRQEISDKRGVLFHHGASIRAFEEFFESVVSRTLAGKPPVAPEI
jgi:predicted O-linked N-acetylglucosamine transferase (SPINDLY family)